MLITTVPAPNWIGWSIAEPSQQLMAQRFIISNGDINPKRREEKKREVGRAEK